MNLVPITNSAALAPLEPTGNGWIDLVAPAAELAKMIAGTEFVPQEMRNKPAAVTACILYGSEVGIGPMQALAKVDIVKGRPAPRAELARALALAAGHELWVEESTNTKVTVAGRRRNSDHVMKVTWTMDDAKRAGIASGNYQKYPRQMLLARASAELVRQLCPDALGGITMFAEEADDQAEPEVAAAAAPDTASTRRRRATQPVARDDRPTEPVAVAPQADVDGPSLPHELNDADTEQDDADKPTQAMTRRAMALFGEHGLADRDDRLSFVRSVTGRDVQSWNDVTCAEASQVIDALTSEGA